MVELHFKFQSSSDVCYLPYHHIIDSLFPEVFTTHEKEISTTKRKNDVTSYL